MGFGQREQFVAWLAAAEFFSALLSQLVQLLHPALPLPIQEHQPMLRCFGQMVQGMTVLHRVERSCFQE